MNHIYPEDRKLPYYVEFERGDRKWEFTMFKRQWMHSEEELTEMEAKNPGSSKQHRLFNEVHPWNIFTAEYGPEGSMPDEEWIRFMVDSLNAGDVLCKEEYPTGAFLPEDTIHGKQTTKEKAYEGLGNTMSWAMAEEKLWQEFSAKPSQTPTGLLRHIYVEYQNKRLELPQEIAAMIVNMIGAGT